MRGSPPPDQSADSKKDKEKFVEPFFFSLSNLEKKKPVTFLLLNSNEVVSIELNGILFSQREGKEFQC